MTDLPVENTPDVAEPAHEAARGQVIYITERGERVAAIVPPGMGAILERLPAGALDEMASVAADNGMDDIAELLEDLADRAAALESLADPGPDIPHEQVRAEAGL